MLSGCTHGEVLADAGTVVLLRPLRYRPKERTTNGSVSVSVGTRFVSSVILDSARYSNHYLVPYEFAIYSGGCVGGGGGLEIVREVYTNIYKNLVTHNLCSCCDSV